MAQNGDEFEILYPDPIAGPEVQILYINSLNRKSNVACGDIIETSDLFNDAEDGERAIYSIILRNTGGIDLHIQEGDIRVEGQKFSLISSVWRLFPDGIFHRGQDVVLKIAHDNGCFNAGSGDLELSIRGLSERPCRISFIETISSVDSERALLSFGEQYFSHGANLNDGVFELKPISFISDNSTMFITVYNLGNEEAVINGLTSTGPAEILENINFPFVIPAGGFFNFRIRNTQFSCATRTGEFIFDTDAEFAECGFGDVDGIISYRQVSYLDCPGSDYEVSVDDTTIGCGTTVSFDGNFIPNAENRTFTITNSGSATLIAGIDPRVFGQRFFRPEYFLSTGCNQISTFEPCIQKLEPGESHSFTVALSPTCRGNCDAYIFLYFSTSPYTCRINLSDSPAGIDVPDFPKPGMKLLEGDETQNFRVFPTLANESITFTTGKEINKATEVQVIDQYGRRVKAFSLPPFTSRAKLSVNDLVPGFYYVHIAGGKEAQRFIKQ